MRARRSYHAPWIDWNEAWAAAEHAQIILLDGRDRDTRVHIVTFSAIRRRLSSHVRQGAGRPSTGIAGTTVSIF